MSILKKSPLHQQYDGMSGGSGAYKQAREASIPVAIIAGLAASIVGALIWAVASYVTGYKIGWVAVGIGFLVGIAVRFGGRGNEGIYQIAGAALALFGCVMGNAFMVIAILSKVADMGMFEAYSTIGISGVIDLMKTTASPMDLIFYGIAAYEGWRFSVSPEEGADG